MNSTTRAIELDKIQRWMQSVITHPAGVTAGIESAASRSLIDIVANQAEQVICRSKEQSGIERMHVYANAYFARLLEVMHAEYPALFETLGNTLFDEFAFGYLQQHPSQSYTLSDLGRDFPTYLKSTRPPKDPADDSPDWADFLIDLATLERTYSEVFDGPGVEEMSLLQPDDLQTVDMSVWPQMRLKTVPCLRVSKFQFPVHEYVSSIRRQESPSIPTPEPTWLIITRRDFIVRRIAVTEPEFVALSVLVHGGSVSESVQATATTGSSDIDSLAREIHLWFQNWSLAGYFHQLI